MTNKRAILWIVPKWPLPASDGARVAICNLIEPLCRKGEQVVLLAICGKDERVDIDECKSKLGVDDCIVIRRPITPQKIFVRVVQMVRSFFFQPHRAVTMRNYSGASLRSMVRRVLERHWDVIVFDTLHSAYPLSRNGLFERLSEATIIYRSHNHEQSIWRGRASKARSFFEKLFLKHQACLVEKFENSLALCSDVVATVSANDAKLFRADGRSLVETEVVPIGYSFDTPSPFVGRENLKLLFLGKLDWPPNYDGLVWFLDNVWPKVESKRSDIELEVVGSGSGGKIPSICSQLARVTFSGYVPSLDSVIASSDAFIVPIFYGSGTRVKAIEAARAGRACISSKLGVEGLDLKPSEHYTLAESLDDWIEVLLGIEKPQLHSQGEQVHTYLADKFDKYLVADKLRARFDKVLDAR